MILYKEQINCSKKNDNLNFFLRESIQEMWDTMTKPNLRLLIIEKEECQIKDPEKIFNKMIEERFSN